MLRLDSISKCDPISVYDSCEYGRTVAHEERGDWIVVEDTEGNWRLPLVVRAIPGSSKVDATTPYGYGGFYISEQVSHEEGATLWAETKEKLAERGVVSVFLRFPPFLPGQAERAQRLEGLSVSEISKTILVPTGSAESMWAEMRSRSRNAVRAAQKMGCSVEVVNANEALVEEVRVLYEQTMSRVGASSNYFFSTAYYKNLIKLGNRLHVARVLDAHGKCVSASYILSDSWFAHYHLSGSTGTISGANNLLLWAVMEWAATVGLKAVHLGGGLTKDDSLYKFKASFGGHSAPFSIGKAILLEEEYDQLVATHSQELGSTKEELLTQDFFPAYRAVP